MNELLKDGDEDLNEEDKSIHSLQSLHQMAPQHHYKTIDNVDQTRNAVAEPGSPVLPQGALTHMLPTKQSWDVKQLSN